MKRIILAIFVFSILASNSVNAYSYDEEESQSYTTALQYLQNNQYTSAIAEFKKALRQNPRDLSSKIGLTNAYISRAAYYNNKSSEYAKAANDLRSALFYMKYYDDMSDDYNSNQSMVSAQRNLDMVFGTLSFDKTPQSRYNAAKTLRTQGEFAASAYEYFQILDNEKYQKDANIAIGDIMNILGKGQKSVFYYERAVRVDSLNADLHLKLARAYESIGNSEGAATEYNLALQNSSEKEDILNSLEKIWQQKVAENQNDAESHANLGVVYQKQGKYELAMSEYKKAEQINPANITTRLNLGTLYQFQKNYDGAIAAYNSIIQLYPNNINAHIYKAQCLRALGRNDEAVREYQLATSYDPTNKVARTELFDLLKSTMTAEQILDYIYKNVQQEPRNANTYYDFAYELHRANKLDDAIVFYKETIKLDPKMMDCYINLSQVYRQKNDYVEALKVIEEANRLFPNSEEIKKQHNSLKAEVSSNLYADASKLFEQAKYQEAIDVYNKIQPASSESLIGIAVSYQSLENYKMAAEYYKKAMSIDSTNAEIPYYLGSVYVQLEDYANAKTSLSRAVSMDRTNKQAKELLDYVIDQENTARLGQALDFYEKGRYPEALKALNDILLKDSRNGLAYYYRGLIYDVQKKFTAAVADYQNAVKYSPDLALAYYSLGVDYETLGKTLEAKNAYIKYLNLTSEVNDYTKYAKKRVAEIK